MRALAIISLLFALPACKEKPLKAEDREPSAGAKVDYSALLTKFSELRTMMCACNANDKVCADKVHGFTTAWTKETIEKDASIISKMSVSETKAANVVSDEYAACMRRAYGGQRIPWDPPPVVKVTDADQIVKLAFAEVRGDLVVAELKLSYVRADGTVDPTYGTAEVRLGRLTKPAPADDPARPLGAPVPVDAAPVDDGMTRCPKYSWKDGTRTDSQTLCHVSGVGIAKPRCSVAEVWKRARDAGAPAEGLAVLTLYAEGPGSPEQYWSFSIDDEPRNVHFSHGLPDRCDPTLEKP